MHGMSARKKRRNDTTLHYVSRDAGFVHRLLCSELIQRIRTTSRDFDFENYRTFTAKQHY